MSLLFEYGNWQKAHDPQGLSQFLVDIWGNQIKDQVDDEDKDSRYQPFLKFDSEQIRANNYIGFIQHNDQLIEIYPKVFAHLHEPDRNLMLQHIFYWFSYCRKWRFPFTKASLDNREIDKFPELIIYLIANQFLDTVSVHPLMQYHPIEETLRTPKGSLNFSRYINKGLSTGNLHLLECDHEPFLFDNKINRIIKYCSRILLNQTKFAESHRMLQDIVFILDEVEDVPVSIYDVNSVKLNTFYDDYRLTLEMCKSILNQHLYSHNAYDSSQWCLLFPMEYVFEDFVAGFMETHFSDKWKVKYQKSDEYLAANPDAFQMQHDIFLTSKTGPKREIIIDTKYKLRKFLDGDVKKGIAQSDLYQVVSYAYRRGCKEVVLIYPNTSEEQASIEQFEIHSGFDGKDIINVKVVEISFWSMSEFHQVEISLKKSFEKLLS